MFVLFLNLAFECKYYYLLLKNHWYLLFQMFSTVCCTILFNSFIMYIFFSDFFNALKNNQNPS